MIIVDNITKYYKVHGKRNTLFERLSFTLNAGDKLALLGPNGVGKSTLLRLLCGVEYPNAGKITRTASISWPIGLGSGFISKLTGRENIRFICRLFSCNSVEQKQKIDFVEDFAEIGNYFDMLVSTYSSGMLSRLAFGMSMAFDFDFYVIDETMAVGDAYFRQKCLDVFKSKAQDKGIIMVSHDMETVKQFCTQALYLNKQKLSFSHQIDDIINLYHAA